MERSTVLPWPPNLHWAGANRKIWASIMIYWDTFLSHETYFKTIKKNYKTSVKDAAVQYLCKYSTRVLVQILQSCGSNVHSIIEKILQLKNKYCGLWKNTELLQYWRGGVKRRGRTSDGFWLKNMMYCRVLSIVYIIVVFFTCPGRAHNHPGTVFFTYMKSE